jgi:hypothetical protein
MPEGRGNAFGESRIAWRNAADSVAKMGKKGSTSLPFAFRLAGI